MSAANDVALLRIVQNAWEDSARRSGGWLRCRPGCSQCCRGVFAISMLDASRLQRGLIDLERSHPEKATRVRQRVDASRDALAASYPGNTATGELFQSEDYAAAFEEFANEEPCPVLDPATQTCDLYAARPMTCRVFGPPVRSEDGLGVCELCFDGAPETEIAAAEMHLPDSVLEEALTKTLGDARTIVPFAFPPLPVER